MQYVITIEATNEEQAIYALHEAAKGISKGCRLGFDGNDESNYHFERMEVEIFNGHPELALSQEELRTKYQDNSGGHPHFSKTDWQHEVDNDCTVLGYWEWVTHQIEAWEPEGSDDGEN